MTDRPIIFSAPMVRALLDSRKTQTRRLAWGKPIPGLYESSGGPLVPILRPTIWHRVKPGDRLWVRETHYQIGGRGPEEDYIAYAEEMQPGSRWDDVGNPVRKAIPSIHMPRWASRLTLVVTETKMARVQEIGEADALAEGVTGWCVADRCEDCHVRAFRVLWNTLHKPGKRWDDDPEVVALTYSVHKVNIDRLDVSPPARAAGPAPDAALQAPPGPADSGAGK